VPLEVARIAFSFPQTDSAEESVFIFTAHDSSWQSIEPMHQTAAKDDIIGDERAL